MKERNHALTVRLDEVEYNKLKQLAEESGISLAGTIRQLIRKAKSRPTV